MNTSRPENKSVTDYIQEMDGLTLICDYNEIEEMRMARFLAGLREDLREKLETIPNPTYEGLCS